MEPVIHLRNVFVIRIWYSAVDKKLCSSPLLSSPFSCSGIIVEHRFPRSNRLDLAQTRAPAFTRANDTGHALTHEVQARRSRDTRSGSPSRAGTPVEATGGAPTPASAWDPPDPRF